MWHILQGHCVCCSIYNQLYKQCMLYMKYCYCCIMNAIKLFFKRGLITSFLQGLQSVSSSSLLLWESKTKTTWITGLKWCMWEKFISPSIIWKMSFFFSQQKSEFGYKVYEKDLPLFSSLLWCFCVTLSFPFLLLPMSSICLRTNFWSSFSYKNKQHLSSDLSSRKRKALGHLLCFSVRVLF